MKNRQQKIADKKELKRRSRRAAVMECVVKVRGDTDLYRGTDGQVEARLAKRAEALLRKEQRRKLMELNLLQEMGKSLAEKQLSELLRLKLLLGDL